VPPWQRGEPAALDLIQATQVATPFPRPGWAYEEKVDGYRMLVYKLGGSVQLVSRQGKEFTQRFPALARDVAALGAESAILDTEVAVFDRQLVSRFECLMARPKDDVATPPMLMAFDLLELDGEDQRKRPLGERRLILPERRSALVASGRGRRCYEQTTGAGSEGPGVAVRAGRPLKWLKIRVPTYREGERGFYKP
jgi:bifunctional non-homologous end joining protein LigD